MLVGQSPGPPPPGSRCFLAGGVQTPPRLPWGEPQTSRVAPRPSPRKSCGQETPGGFMVMTATTLPLNNVPLSARQATDFPVLRRPQLRTLEISSPMSQVSAWFDTQGITFGDYLTSEQTDKATRLFYTWKHCFVTRMREVQPTDLIQHSIDIVSNARPVYHKITKYTPQEQQFAGRIFPEMEEAGILVRGTSEWGAHTKSPPRKKGSADLRVVHNIIPINAATIKPAYPMHSIEEVLNSLMKPTFNTFFITDAANGYWAVPIRPRDEYKAGIVTPHGQYLYRRIGQGLKGAPHTYSMFTDLVFGPLPATDSEPAHASIIGQGQSAAFVPSMDDHLGAAKGFDEAFDHLHTRYFPRVEFGPVYISGRKTYVFCRSMEMVGLTGSADGAPRGRWNRTQSRASPVCGTIFVFVVVPVARFLAAAFPAPSSSATPSGCAPASGRPSRQIYQAIASCSSGAAKSGHLVFESQRGLIQKADSELD